MLWVWSRAIGCVELKDVMSYTTQHINENNIVGIEPCKPESLQTTSVLVFFCLMYIASGKWSMRWQCTHLGSTRSPAEGKCNSHKFLQAPNGTTGSTILRNMNKTYAPLIHSRCVFVFRRNPSMMWWTPPALRPVKKRSSVILAERLANCPGPYFFFMFSIPLGAGTFACKYLCFAFALNSLTVRKNLSPWKKIGKRR